MKILKHPALLLIALIGVFACTPVLAATYHFSQDGWFSEGFPDGSYAFNTGRVYGEFEVHDYDRLNPIEEPDTYLIPMKAIHFAGNPLFDTIERNLRGEIINLMGMGFNGHSIFYAELTNLWISTGTSEDIGTKGSSVTLTYIINDQFITGPGPYLFLSVITDYDDIWNIDPSNRIELSATSNQAWIITETPLPGALGLFGLGLAGLSYFRKKRIF
jgi:PEP-CTERM motif